MSRYGSSYGVYGLGGLFRGSVLPPRAAWRAYLGDRSSGGFASHLAGTRKEHPTPLYEMLEVDPKKGFVQNFLSWTVESVTVPLAAMHQPEALPVCHTSTDQYLKSFLPCILDDARAVVAQGLQGGFQRSRREFDLHLIGSVVPTRIPGDPTIMRFSGHLPSGIERSGSMLAWLLIGELEGKKICLLGLACENDEDQFSVKVRVSGEEYLENRRLFQFHSGVRWQGTYLGSLIRHERMYLACTGGNIERSSLIRRIYQPKIADPSLQYSSVDLALRHRGHQDSSGDVSGQGPQTSERKLNSAQQKAIDAFMGMQKGVMLLQGSPGTGKTTTIISLLRRLVHQGRRILVTAPSDEAVQALAERFLRANSDVSMILVGDDSKVPDHLRPIFLDAWLEEMYADLDQAKAILNSILYSELSENATLATVKEEFTEKVQNVINLLTETNRRGKQYGMGISYFESRLKKIREIKELISDFNPRGSLTHRKINALRARLTKIVRDNQNRIYLVIREVSERSAGIQQILLEKSAIVFASLSACGCQEMLDKMSKPDALIVDNAGESVEAEMLVALQHNPENLLLVGDADQQPAAVSSEAAKEKNFGRSMVRRLIEEAEQPCLVLDTQYRIEQEKGPRRGGQARSERVSGLFQEQGRDGRLGSCSTGGDCTFSHDLTH